MSWRPTSKAQLEQLLSFREIKHFIDKHWVSTHTAGQASESHVKTKIDQNRTLTWRVCGRQISFQKIIAHYLATHTDNLPRDGGSWSHKVTGVTKLLPCHSITTPCTQEGWISVPQCTICMHSPNSAGRKEGRAVFIPRRTAASQKAKLGYSQGFSALW